MQNRSLSIGVFADVQYADKDNKEGDGTHATRRYRLGLRKIREVLDHLSRWEPREGGPYLSFSIQLGDIIDGNGDRSEAELIAMLEQVEAGGYTHGREGDGGAESAAEPADAEQNSRHLYHVIGNHCLRVPRAILHRHLRMGERGYYEIKRHGWRLLLLDSQDISLSGNEEGTPKHNAALEYLERREGDANAVPYNGGLGEEQYEWIEDCLSSARQENENVILFSHIPILLAASQPHLLMWNNARLRSLLGKYKDVVRMFVCGHDHAGGYARDEYGVHHVTMPGILETEEHSNAHAVFHLAADGTVEIEGHGAMASRTCTAESP